MKFVIAGNLRKEGVPKIAQRVLQRLEAEGADYVVEQSLAVVLRKRFHAKLSGRTVTVKNLATAGDMLISLGGRWDDSESGPSGRREGDADPRG